MSLPKVRLDRCLRESEGLWKLDASQTGHLVKSLRCYEGASVEGLLKEAGGSKLLMRLESRNGEYFLREVSVLEQTADKLEITLLIAILKAGQFDDVLRAAAELGVKEIFPVICDRSVPKFDESNTAQKSARWQKILEEGASVSGSAVPTKINPAVMFSAAPWERLPKKRFAAVISEDSRLLPEAAIREGELTYAVGPEGDWSEREKTELLAMDFVPVTLGTRILRASTAAIAGIAWFRLSSC